jgi:hypothetical protein
MIRSIRFSFFFALCALFSSALLASPFASNILLTGGGTNVSFILNEDADSLAYSINGGVDVPITPTKGTHSFTIAPGDKFAISTSKNSPTGYTIPTGGTIAADGSGLSAVSNASGLNQISSDTNNLVKFNSPRGVSVSNNPNAPNFGTVYVANSAAGTTGGRSVGDGMYALFADQTDATGNGNTAANPGSVFVASSSTPWKTYAGRDGNVYVSDFTDTNGNVYVMNSGLTTATNAFNGIGGPSAVPATQKHGSVTAVFTEGSLGGSDQAIYTIDEDLTELTGTGAGDNTFKLNLWKYSVGAGPYPFAGAPTKVNGAGAFLINSTNDVVRGADGKFYVSQNRTGGTDAGSVIVLNADGTVAFNSLTASGGAQDILRNVFSMAVSQDQKWMALMLNNSDVAVVPLVGGIPDMANRLVVDTGTNVNSGRAIAFDAANNIHYTSSGQALYRVLSPGGQTLAVTSWDGSSYSFAMYVPEPASGMLMLIGLAAAFGARRARKNG